MQAQAGTHLKDRAEEVGRDAIFVELVRRLNDGRRRERGQLALVEQRFEFQFQFQVLFTGAEIELYLDMLLLLLLSCLTGGCSENGIHVEDVAFQG
jgi:hypothetical protein